MEIKWPPFPAEVGLLDHPATELDIEAGRAAFVMRDNSGQLVGSPVPMGMTRLGFHDDGKERRMGVLVQLEAAGDQCITAILNSDGSFSIGTPKEFDESPRHLIFYRKAGYGLDQAAKALAKQKMTRKGHVLAVQARDGTVVYIRNATGAVAAQEIELLKENEHAEGLAACDALFEVSFPVFEEVYDNSLLDVQCILRDELRNGYEYWGWNGHVDPIGWENEPGT